MFKISMTYELKVIESLNQINTQNFILERINLGNKESI